MILFLKHETGVEQQLISDVFSDRVVTVFVTSCLMVSCITLSQSQMMLSVSYCIRYSQP